MPFDLDVMTPDAATLAATILVVVYFAFFSEVGRASRDQGEIGIKSRLPIFGGMAIVTIGMTASFFQLVNAVNVGGLSGSEAVLVWISTGVTFVVTALSYLAWSLFR